MCPSSKSGWQSFQEFFRDPEIMNELLDHPIEEEKLGEIIDYVSQMRSKTVEHWSAPKPASDKYVWRYLNFTQLLSILERKQVWFTNVNQFDDPYEGTVPKANFEAEVKEIRDTFDITLSDAKTIHQHTLGSNASSVNGAYVNCWNINKHQSAALWEQYVDSSQGIAIRTTVSQLRDAISPDDRNIEFGEVVYIDYDEESIPVGDLPAIYHKRKSFEHEKEYRLSYMSEEEDADLGIYVNVDIEKLIDMIVISPVAPGWFSTVVNKVLHRYEIDCELRKSDLYLDPIV